MIFRDARRDEVARIVALLADDHIIHLMSRP